jgi:putative endonuclease
VDKQPAVYILASKRNGTLYVGVTSDLRKRIWEHKNDMVEGFTKRYHVHLLVWYELHEAMESAILREKRIKEWKRAWKVRIIESDNTRYEKGMKRTSLALDESLLEEAIAAIGAKTKKEAIEAGLKALIRMKRKRQTNPSGNGFRDGL